MKREEMKSLVDLINTFEVEDEIVGDAVDMPIVEGVIIETEKPIGVDEVKTKKMFRNQVPEGFDWAEAQAVRSPVTGDRVFLKYGEEKRWVPDLETLEQMGWDLASVKDISDDEMRGLKEKIGILSSKLW